MSVADRLPSQLAAELATRYDVLRLLGRGGMGAVWLAHERTLDRPVAIKVLAGEAIESDSVRERFRREARIAARLVHPHIVPLHAFGETPDALYLVMGYVEGETLAARLERETRLPRNEAARILGEIADALGFAHREGVVHRDVKPENILLDRRSGRALLADFGVAHVERGTSMTRTGIAVGTPSYMSPEQAVGSDIDGRSDLYALGVVGYRMLAGRLPFTDDSARAVLSQHAAERPGDLESLVGAREQSIARVVMRALEKDPADRWAHGEDMRAELESAARGVPTLKPELEHIQVVGTKLMAATGAVGAIWVLAGFWNERIFTHTAFAAPMALTLATFPMIAAGIAAFTARKHGWRDTLRAMFNPPASWAHWWPKALRRPDDVWERLPKPLRRLRNVIDGVVSYLVLDMASFLVLATTGGGAYGDWLLATLRSQPGWTGPLMFGLPKFAALGWIAYEYVRTRRALGVTAGEVNELLGRPHTADDSVWAQPRYARLLTPEAGDTPSLGARTPRTPDELARAIRDLGTRLRAGGLLPDGDSIAAAQTVRDAIASLDDEIRRLAGELDPAEGERLERRLAAVRGDPDLQQLLESQREVWRRLQTRLAEKQARRERLRDQLVTLWMQLFDLDARVTRGSPVDPELTGQVRVLIGDLAAAGDALSIVEKLVAPASEDREPTPVP